MAALVMFYFLRLIEQAAMDGRRRVRAIGHHHGLQQLLLDSASIFLLTGTLILMHKLATTSASAPSNAELVFIAFILWLVGAAFGMLSVVAPQFPRLVVAAAAVARALRNYLLGGL